MNMLETFFSIKDTGKGGLFEGLSIWEEEKYRQFQGTGKIVSFYRANTSSNSLVGKLIREGNKKN